jgi:hypothetical protein
MNVLILRNCPIVILSYLVKNFRQDDDKIYVMTHEHAQDSVYSLDGVKDVIPYNSKELFRYKYLKKDQVEKLKTLNFQKICFCIDKNQKNGFENLLQLSKKIIGKGGAIIGASPDGDKIHFTRKTYFYIFSNFYIQMFLSSFVFIAILAALPVLCLCSFFYFKNH